MLLAYNEGPDQTARMRRLIWAFAVCICPKTRFRMARPNYKIVDLSLFYMYFWPNVKLL